MFRSPRKYSNLDDFYSTTVQNSLTSWSEIEKRIGETDSLYRNWRAELWQFTSDNEENQYLLSEVQNTIDVMRSAVLNYIMADFNASIVSSSAAVEKIGNVILYLNFVKAPPTKTYTAPEVDWIAINTVYGTRYYDNHWDRIVQRGSVFIKFQHSVLNGKMLENIKKCGYPSHLLVNANDTLDKSIFVGRRNAAARGDFSRILIEEQIHGYIVNNPDDLVKIVNNRIASLDQYSKASDFITNTMSIFDRCYKSISSPEFGKV